MGGKKIRGWGKGVMKIKEEIKHSNTTREKDQVSVLPYIIYFTYFKLVSFITVQKRETFDVIITV